MVALRTNQASRPPAIVNADVLRTPVPTWREAELPLKTFDNPGLSTPLYASPRLCGNAADCPPPENRLAPLLQSRRDGPTGAQGIPVRGPVGLGQASIGTLGASKSLSISQYRLPSERVSVGKRGGVQMATEVVTNQPVDTSGLFGDTPTTPLTAPQGTRPAASQPAELFAPFLVFSAVEVAQ